MRDPLAVQADARDALSQLIAQSGLSVSAFARVGMGRDDRTVRRWLSGELEIPQSTVWWLNRITLRVTPDQYGYSVETEILMLDRVDQTRILDSRAVAAARGNPTRRFYMDYTHALAEQVSRYTDAELTEAREMMSRWSETRDMPDVVHSLIHVLDVEHAFRRAEDSAQQAAAAEVAP